MAAAPRSTGSSLYCHSAKSVCLCPPTARGAAAPNAVCPACNRRAGSPPPAPAPVSRSDVDGPSTGQFTGGMSRGPTPEGDPLGRELDGMSSGGLAPIRPRAQLSPLNLPPSPPKKD